MSNSYDPTWESLSAHAVPDWFDRAKLGIFIHWGPYSIPAYSDPEGRHPYAEWYPYYMYEEESDTYEHHRETYGEDVEYVDFIDQWEADDWDPDAWADFFADVGARYVVLTAEHHDGFPLWPTHYTKYNAAEMGPKRDIVGELAESIRDRDMRFAGSYHANLNYYQPGFDGQFGHPDFEAGPDGHLDDDTEPGPEYVDFMNAKHRELIRRYEPDLLWFDVPMADAERTRARELVAEYYDTAEQWGKEVAVNDRAATDAVEGGLWDFRTPEYDAYDEITDFKWEACRGIGNSFGYNAEETEEHHLSTGELVHSFIDIVSKNGNLLINVGPRADGTIPELQRRPLEGLGAWLDGNGEAIYGTRPWVVSEDSDSDVEVRYTYADGTLYAIALERPGEELALGVGDHFDLDRVESVRLLEGDRDLEFDAAGDALAIDLSGIDVGDAPAYGVAIAGAPVPE